MVPGSPVNLQPPVELFEKEDLAQLMRQRHGAECQNAVGAPPDAIGKPVRAAENEKQMLSFVARVCKKRSKRKGRMRLSSLIQNNDRTPATGERIENTMRFVVALLQRIAMRTRFEKNGFHLRCAIDAFPVTENPFPDPGRTRRANGKQSDVLHVQCRMVSESAALHFRTDAALCAA